MRFRIKTEEGDVCKPLMEILEDSLGIARTSQRGRLITATAFLSTYLGGIYSILTTVQNRYFHCCFSYY